MTFSRDDAWTMLRDELVRRGASISGRDDGQFLVVHEHGTYVWAGIGVANLLTRMLQLSERNRRVVIDQVVSMILGDDGPSGAAPMR